MADDWKTAHEIANHVKYAETVDAIPVERIKNWCKDEPYWTNLGLQLIDDWRLENESHISD